MHAMHMLAISMFHHDHPSETLHQHQLGGAQNYVQFETPTYKYAKSLTFLSSDFLL